MIRPSFATATDMDGMSPPATASVIVAPTSSNAGLGTVAVVGTCARTEPKDDPRRQVVTVAESRAWLLFIVDFPRVASVPECALSDRHPLTRVLTCTVLTQYHVVDL